MRAGIAQVIAERQAGHRGAEPEGEHQDAGGEARIDPERALRKEARQRVRLLPALGHQEAADGEEHEHADEAGRTLVQAQYHQGIAVLGALREQEGMGEDHGGRGDQAQRVEIVLAVHGRLRRGPALDGALRRVLSA